MVFILGGPPTDANAGKVLKYILTLSAQGEDTVTLEVSGQYATVSGLNAAKTWSSSIITVPTSGAKDGDGNTLVNSDPAVGPALRPLGDVPDVGDPLRNLRFDPPGQTSCRVRFDLPEDSTGYVEALIRWWRVGSTAGSGGSARVRYRTYFDITSLTVGTRFNWDAQARYSSGILPSVAVRGGVFKTKEYTVPPPPKVVPQPTGFQVRAGSLLHDRVTLTCVAGSGTNSEGITGYKFEYQLSGDSGWTPARSRGVVAWLSNLVAEDDYRARVTALGGAGYEDSAPVYLSFTTPAEVVDEDAPAVGIASTSSTTTQIVANFFSLQNRNRIFQFEAQARLHGQSTWSIRRTNSNPLSDRIVLDGLPSSRPGREYDVRVRAVGGPGYGNGAWSPVVRVTLRSTSAPRPGPSDPSPPGGRIQSCRGRP